MAAIQESAYRASVLVLSGNTSGELVALANNNVSAVSDGTHGLVLDNTGNKDMMVDFELNTGTFGGAPTAGAVIELHAYRSLDGSNYATALATGATLPNDPPIGVFVINGTGTSQRLHITGVSLSPGKYKFAIVNRSGQAFPAANAAIGVTAYAYSFTSI